MKQLCEYLGGSHLYGTNTPDSDVDVRGVFMNTEPSFILGLDRFDHQISVQKAKDGVEGHDLNLKEVRHYFELCSKSNTEALESLFAPDEAFRQVSPEWARIRSFRGALFDSDRLFDVLRGYAQGEYRLVSGERPGKIGEKRAKGLQMFGYSPRNLVHCLRLLQTGILFYRYGTYVVRWTNADWSPEVKEMRDLMMDIKLNPHNYNKDSAKKLYEAKDEELQVTFAGSKRPRHAFCRDVANDLLREFYLPYLNRWKLTPTL
jgi:hypothetical protein